MPENVEAGVNKSVVAELILPKGLPHALFPLVFNIVVEKFSLSPDSSVAGNNLPVITGLNQYGEPVKGGNYFGYEITVTEEEYNQEGGNVKKLYFKTAYQNSSSVVNVYHPYFNIATDNFTVAN